jgi:hypothetical protein
VDLQASLSVHFDESSFDLLKDKISLPENDSLGELEMDMGALAIKEPERERREECVIVVPSTGADADAESDSESEPEFVGLLEERLRDMKIEDEENIVPQSEVGKGRDIISTPPPPAQFSSCNVLSQCYSPHRPSILHWWSENLSFFPFV